MKKIFDLGNTLVIVATFILFAIALFVKGFSKDLLLEAGVLLISIKIIMMSRSTLNSNKEIIKKLDDLDNKLSNSNNHPFEK